MNPCSNSFAYWRDRGLTVRAANLLINLSCHTIEDVLSLGEDEIKRSHGMGPPTFNEIAEIVGWTLLPVPDRKLRKIRKQVEADDNDHDGLVTAVLDQIEFRKHRSR